tara:strand:+ start:3928 stop:4896 length:969 start_codon:yes stop_codon:yes gene_type:complete
MIGGVAMILDELLENGECIIMDGAIGTEIARLGGDMHTSAWCGLANKTHPDVVRQVHRAYLRAGAHVVTANTFATCRHVLAGAGLADEAASITARAVELARQAVVEEACDRPVAVAGSMSNNYAWIPGTVSPDPRYFPTPEQQITDYREMADAIASAGADFIVLEMMSDVTNASLTAEAAVATGLPVWIGISCVLQPGRGVTAWDAHTAHPAEELHPEHEPHATLSLEEVIEAMIQFEPQVMGIMHSTVSATGPGLDVLKRAWSGPIMAYPETNGVPFIEPGEFSTRCSAWVNEGVQIIGGCCGTTIEHIRTLTKDLNRQAN